MSNGYVYNKAKAEAAKAERKARELARRAALTLDECLAEIPDTVHLNADGLVEVWADETQTTTEAITVEQFVPYFRAM